MKKFFCILVLMAFVGSTAIFTIGCGSSSGWAGLLGAILVITCTAGTGASAAAFAANVRPGLRAAAGISASTMQIRVSALSDAGVKGSELGTFAPAYDSTDSYKLTCETTELPAANQYLVEVVASGTNTVLLSAVAYTAGGTGKTEVDVNETTTVEQIMYADWSKTNQVTFNRFVTKLGTINTPDTDLIVGNLTAADKTNVEDLDYTTSLPEDISGSTITNRTSLSFGSILISSVSGTTLGYASSSEPDVDWFTDELRQLGEGTHNVTLEGWVQSGSSETQYVLTCTPTPTQITVSTDGKVTPVNFVITGSTEVRNGYLRITNNSSYELTEYEIGLTSVINYSHEYVGTITIDLNSGASVDILPSSSSVTWSNTFDYASYDDQLYYQFDDTTPDLAKDDSTFPSSRYCLTLKNGKFGVDDITNTEIILINR